MHNLSWKIGNIEIFQIPEIEELELFAEFIPDATPENIDYMDWLKPDFITGKNTLNALVQSFLIKSDGKNILVDTCNGNDRDRPGVPSWGNLKTNYLEKFENLGVKPEDIDVVICTHMHFDHVGWNTKQENGKWVPTFPNAQYLFSKGEYEYWVKKPDTETQDEFNAMDDSITPIVEAGLAQFIEDDHIIDNSVRLISTPGHTPHHVSVLIESQNESAIISGDILHHPCQITEQDWICIADTFSVQATETRKKLLSEIVGTDILLIGSYFYYPIAGKVIKKDNKIIFKTQNGAK